jgi:hypothetical protein
VGDRAFDELLASILRLALPLGARKVNLAFISPISRLYLAYISPISPQYLLYISHISRLPLGARQVDHR